MDALRLLAALAVVLFHFTTRDHVRWGELPHEVFPVLSGIIRYGYAGVHLFFAISGFVILMSVWGRTPRQFVASRVARLYPAFWVAVLLTATLRWLWPTFGSRTPGEVLANLTMFHEPFGVPHVDGVYWTLWVEMQFYLLMLLFSFVGITVRRVLVAATVVPLVCTALALWWPATGSAVTFLSWASMFGAGMALYLVYREGHTVGRWAVVLLNTAQGMAIAAELKTTAIDNIASGHTTSAVVLALVVLGTVVAVAVVSLVPAVAHWDLSLLTWLGALTYPLYLTHEYVGWALIETLYPALGRWATLAVATALCLALAWSMHRFVERPVHGPLRRALAGTPPRGD